MVIVHIQTPLIAGESNQSVPIGCKLSEVARRDLNVRFGVIGDNAMEEQALVPVSLRRGRNGLLTLPEFEDNVLRWGLLVGIGFRDSVGVLSA